MNYNENIDILNNEIKKLNIDKDKNNNVNINYNVNNDINNYYSESKNITNSSEINHNININNNINQTFNINNNNNILYNRNNFNSSKNIRRKNINILNNANNNIIANNISANNFFQNKNIINNFNISNISNMKINNNSLNFLNIMDQNSGMNMSFPSVLSSFNEKELFDNCGNLCKEQIKCRILEKKLEENPSLASSYIYNKIKDKFYEISLDQFGNYFMQKVIEYLNMEHIKEILYKKIPTHFRCLCFNQHGTRVIQKLYERIVNIEEYLDYYISLLKPNLKDFIIDQNANHIIIKYINMAPNQKMDFILDFIINNIDELATKKHSCVVLQKCIEYSDQKQKKKLLKEIANKSFKLINNQYGNYVYTILY